MKEAFIHHIRVPQYEIGGRVYDNVEASVGMMQEEKQIWADGVAGRLIGIDWEQQAPLSSTSPSAAQLQTG